MSLFKEQPKMPILFVKPGVPVVRSKILKNLNRKYQSRGKFLEANILILLSYDIYIFK